MSKKKSVVILILISFWLMYSGVTIGIFLYSAKEAYQENVTRKKGLVDFHLDNSLNYLVNKTPKALIRRLDWAKDLQEFDFYLLREKDNVLGYYNKDNYLDGINRDYSALEHFQEDESFALKTLAVLDYKLTIGINKNETKYLWGQLVSRKSAIAQDLVIVTFFVFLIVFLILRDIVRLSQSLQSPDRGRIKRIEGLSKEAEVFRQATLGFENQNQGLRADNLMLASSLGPAVREELKSGNNPPYAIPCCLARVDLNGYTQLFLQREPAELYEILSQYFRRARDIIERYNGLIYQYVGDEVIFMCKDPSDSEPTRRCLSAVRGLFEVAESIRTPAVPDGLRLKASIVSGHLNFVKLDQGHSFSGLPLIESVRMLGQITEKSENTLIAYAESQGFLLDLCEPTHSKIAVFKGFSHESHLLEIRKFVSIDQAASSLSLTELGKNFHGDADIVFLLKKLRLQLVNGQAKDFFELIAPLREFTVGEPSLGIKNAYQQILQHCIDSNELKKQDCKELAALVAIAKNILTSQQVDPIFVNYLDRIEKANDPRVIGNVLAIKSFFGLEAKNIEEKFKSPSNRLAADSLIFSGTKGLSDIVTNRTKEFLSSDNPFFVASGLYVIAALFEYHHSRDLVYVKTNPNFRNLALMVPSYLDHPNEIVRNRAKRSMDILILGGLI